MKKINKLLLPLSVIAACTTIAPAITSCNKSEYNPYVILPTKHVQAVGIPLAEFTFQIKEEGTVYEKIEATAKVTSSSREDVTADVILSTVSDDRHYFTVIVYINRGSDDKALRGGDWAQFNLELKCFKYESDTTPQWTTTSDGYRIDYKVGETTKLFKYESDGFTGEKTIVGWSNMETKYREQAIEANDGVLEFPYDVTKVSPKSNMAMPTACTSIKFRSDSLCNQLYGQQSKNDTKGTPEYPGAFDITAKWNVKEFIINPKLVHLGNPFEKSNFIDLETQTPVTALDETIVFPLSSNKDNVVIDLSAWTRKKIGTIYYKKKSGDYFWEWSKNAWYYYKNCTNSTIKIQKNTKDLWTKYFKDLAGFQFGEVGTKTYWNFVEVE